MKKLPMKVNIPGIVRTARVQGWEAERLAQCFNEMEIHIAQSLLDNELDLDENGDAYLTLNVTTHREP